MADTDRMCIFETNAANSKKETCAVAVHEEEQKKIK